MWRDWFNFSRQDRRAILLLALLTMVLGILFWTQPWWRWSREYETESLVSFKDSFLTEAPIVRVSPHPFDPNTADSSTLVHLGLKPWQAKNMLKYRAAGGKYRKAEDMRKLYGMTDSMYRALEPYIRIAVVDTVDSVTVDTMRVDSLPRWKSEKRDTILNIRTADTTELKMIRGIGSYRARQVVRYREQLGGFVRVEQVLEAKGMEQVADSVLKNFVLDSVVINPMNINKVGVQRLSKHPYLRFEQAKAIYELRRKYVRLDSIEQLYELDCLSEEAIQKITPYLNFDKNN